MVTLAEDSPLKPVELPGPDAGSDETGGVVAVDGAGGRVESVEVATGAALPASLGTASRPRWGEATALGGSEGSESARETVPVAEGAGASLTGAVEAFAFVVSSIA